MGTKTPLTCPLTICRSLGRSTARMCAASRQATPIFGVLALVILMVLSTSADGQTYTVTDLGTLGGYFSEANGVNNSGQIVGFSYTSGNTAYHAFSDSGGTMTDLGTLGGNFSKAFGVNNSGQIVGSSTTGLGAGDAFVDSAGRMLDLNSLLAPGSGWDLEQANAINDNGDIVGYGIDPSGQDHAFLLTPESSSVPEPSTWLAGALTLGLVVLRCRWTCGQPID